MWHAAICNCSTTEQQARVLVPIVIQLDNNLCIKPHWNTEKPPQQAPWVHTKHDQPRA